MESVFSSTYFLRKIEDDLGLELEAKRDDREGRREFWYTDRWMNMNCLDAKWNVTALI